MSVCSIPANGPVVIYDSGVGGLTVSRHLARLRPSEDLVYVADNGWFPYGDRPGLALRARVYAVLDAIVETTRPRAIVIACNTASTAVSAALEDVSASAAVPVFVVLPPVEHAVRRLPNGRHVLLATPNTVRNSLVRRLVATAPTPIGIELVASMGLVHLAERSLAAETVTVADVAAALDPVMARSERNRVGGVILGCTHFPWLLDQLREAFPAARCWSDPALETVRQVLAELAPIEPRSSLGVRGTRALVLTSEHNRGRLHQVFAAHGFDAGVPMPVEPPLTSMHAGVANARHEP